MFTREEALNQFVELSSIKGVRSSTNDPGENITSLFDLASELEFEFNKDNRLPVIYIGGWALLEVHTTKDWNTYEEDLEAMHKWLRGFEVKFNILADTWDTEVRAKLASLVLDFAYRQRVA